MSEHAMTYDEARAYLIARDKRARQLNRSNATQLRNLAKRRGLLYGTMNKDELVSWHLQREFPQTGEANAVFTAIAASAS